MADPSFSRFSEPNWTNGGELGWLGIPFLPHLSSFASLSRTYYESCDLSTNGKEKKSGNRPMGNTEEEDIWETTCSNTRKVIILPPPVTAPDFGKKQKKISKRGFLPLKLTALLETEESSPSVALLQKNESLTFHIDLNLFFPLLPIPSWWNYFITGRRRLNPPSKKKKDPFFAQSNLPLFVFFHSLLFFFCEKIPSKALFFSPKFRHTFFKTFLERFLMQFPCTKVRWGRVWLEKRYYTT